MMKHFVLSLFFLSLSWQVFAEDSAELPAVVDDDFGVKELNETDVSLLPQPRFMQVNIKDKTYTFNFLPVNWYMATEQCTAQNQVLASVMSPQESLDIQNYLVRLGLFNQESKFWIGGSELGHLGQWTWVSTGRPSIYTNWVNWGPAVQCNRHCMEMQADGKWNNADCDQKRPIICQNLPSCY